MTASSAVHCPDCNAEIGADLRTCAECGADLGLWAESQRTPLILPGNPALSADVVRKRVSLPKVAGAAVLGTVLVGSVLYTMPEKQVDDRDQSVAVAGPRMATDPSDVPVARDVDAVATARPADPTITDSSRAYSSGDTAVSRTVAAPTPTPRVTPPVRSAPPAVVPRVPVVTRAAEARPAVASPAVRTVVPTNGVLRMLPLVSNTLRPGERLQLRWSVTDRRTRRTVPARLEFTSTDASVVSVGAANGVVIARAPGTASIIIDGGAAGRNTVRLTVRAPAASQVVTVAPAPAAEPPRVVTSTPVPTAAPQLSVPTLTPAREMPDASDVRGVVDRFVRDMRSGTIRNFELQQFLGDGADHQIRLIDGPSTTRTTTYNIRIAFDLRLSKYDGGGRPVTRIAAITMDVEKRNGQATPSAITIGPLLRP